MNLNRKHAMAPVGARRAAVAMAGTEGSTAGGSADALSTARPATLELSDRVRALGRRWQAALDILAISYMVPLRPGTIWKRLGCGQIASQMGWPFECHAAQAEALELAVVYDDDFEFDSININTYFWPLGQAMPKTAIDPTLPPFPALVVVRQLLSVHRIDNIGLMGGCAHPLAATTLAASQGNTVRWVRPEQLLEGGYTGGQAGTCEAVVLTLPTPQAESLRGYLQQCGTDNERPELRGALAAARCSEVPAQLVQRSIEAAIEWVRPCGIVVVVAALGEIAVQVEEHLKQSCGIQGLDIVGQEASPIFGFEGELPTVAGLRRTEVQLFAFRKTKL